ncbi:restriction endonuclease subunit S [Ideonella sp. DXS22W]|uniref:Restriction endonuclease subunit S n=1 Tax=Pseudaquabacterium inlustre TaxID=2984192 RepID=A0ABU9CK06_9BURK
MSGLPDGWALTNLRQICEFKYGKALPSPLRDGVGFPVFGSNGVVGAHSQPLCNGPAIVIGRKGSVGVVHYSAAPCSPIDTTYFIDSFGSCLPRFLMHRLRAMPLADLNRATAIPGLNREDAYGLDLELPPLPEQQRIADKLDSILARVDACRDRLDRVGPLLQRFRQSVLAVAMNGSLSAEWREANHVGQWTTATIGDVAEVGTGSTPLRSKAGYFDVTGTPWITSSATSLDLVTVAAEFVTDQAIRDHRLRVYPPGTLLVAMYGEGKTRGQVTELGMAATINQACAAVQVDEAKALKPFVKLALRANYLQMRDMAEGGAQPNLNLSKVRAVPLSLPSLEEQAEIVRRVGRLMQVADSLEQRLTSGQAVVGRLPAATLAKAFRGELVPQDPNDEPAAELLARLAASTPPKKTARRGRSTA